MSGQAVETEVKIPITDADSARRLLEGNGFALSAERVFEANNVYDLPGGELRARGCLLRLRQADKRAVLTFKGVSIPGIHKSRPETEVDVSDFAACDAILRQLGYELRFRYEKYRTEYRRPGETSTAMIDETPIGCYLELEGHPEWIDDVASKLGFASDRYVTESYGTLYVNHCRVKGIEPGNMTF